MVTPLEFISKSSYNLSPVQFYSLDATFFNFGCANFDHFGVNFDPKTPKLKGKKKHTRLKLVTA